MEEIWKDFNKYYEVSNMGNVRNKKKGKKLSQKTTPNGYTFRYAKGGGAES